MKTSELQGAALDWAVAKCEGLKVRVMSGVCHDVELLDMQVDGDTRIIYSTDWAQGGPIIERERLTVWFERHDDVDSGLPIWFAQDGYAPAMQGETPLVAAMRCYVAGILGDEVEVPDELEAA